MSQVHFTNPENSLTAKNVIFSLYPRALSLPMAFTLFFLFSMISSPVWAQEVLPEPTPDPAPVADETLIPPAESDPTTPEPAVIEPPTEPTPDPITEPDPTPTPEPAA